MKEQEIIDQALSLLEKRLNKPEHHMNQPADTAAYLRLHFAGLEREAFRVMFLNSQHGLIKFEELFQGTIDGAAVYPREVVKAAIQFNAAAVILTHNHPSGVAEPSSADRRITERLSAALALIDVRVLDHVIVGGDETYSFAQHGLL
jgi:DNA repair protein RadC